MIQNHQKMSKLPESLSKLAKSHHKSVFTRVGARERYTFKNFSTFTFQNNTFIPKLPNILKLTVHRQKNENAIFETGIASMILNCSNAFPRHISRHISRLFTNDHVFPNHCFIFSTSIIDGHTTHVIPKLGNSGKLFGV